MTTAGAVARALASAGIDRVFGLPGGEVLVLIDELRRAGIDFVLMRHEANAGLAAAVYGKLRGHAGVVVTTLGPGAANLMLPICNAHLDQEPLLAISAQIPDEFPASHTHQRLPLHDIYRPVAKYVASITSHTAGDVVQHALSACMERPFGATYLTLSAREATKPVEGDAAAATARKATTADDRGGGARAGARANELVTLLRTAKRPLVIVGLGIDPKNATCLRRWLTDWNLPVAVTPKVKGIVDETAPNFVGVAGGMAADGLMCEAIEAADLRIGFGLDPVEIDKTWHAELPVQWVLEAANATGCVPDGTTLVDHAQVIDALLAAGPPSAWQTPFQAFQDRRRVMLRDRSPQAATMWPGDVVESLAATLPGDAIVTTDVGSHKFLFGQFFPSREPGTFWMSNGLSGMAYGLAAAMGASLARPDVPVVAVVGDGGFSMNCQELESSVRAGAPFVTVVLEDGSYSLIKLAQERRGLEPYRMDFDPIDTVAIAKACGIEALRTTSGGELAAATARAIEQRRSLVIAVPIDYADYRRLC
jgi:acetolactate synthase I/II/III large subunit